MTRFALFVVVPGLLALLPWPVLACYVAGHLIGAVIHRRLCGYWSL